jgi:hypothetical protein
LVLAALPARTGSTMAIIIIAVTHTINTARGTLDGTDMVALAMRYGMDRNTSSMLNGSTQSVK